MPWDEPDIFLSITMGWRFQKSKQHVLWTWEQLMPGQAAPSWHSAPFISTSHVLFGEPLVGGLTATQEEGMAAPRLKQVWEEMSRDQGLYESMLGHSYTSTARNSFHPEDSRQGMCSKQAEVSPLNKPGVIRCQAMHLNNNTTFLD
ncbi:hypothetical protein AAFF_G00356300 [Aldrovandia affinis]|uniref:Uncharacterized protein n=1 Tax=Aldrovandia affinis TaxID=143900 RepID=A0AAD7T8P7_9TELE|nr:hypothetical protein AAFF_G00356300 [Aldrovandia affinis]